MVSTALPVTLAVIHDGVGWRWDVPAETLSSVLDPGVGVPLVLLAAPPDALGWGVVSRFPKVFWQEPWFSVLNALAIPA